MTSRKQVAGMAAALVVFCGLVALGNWQIHRRAWKIDLIARVWARTHGPATAAPGPAEWPHITAQNDEYRRVRTQGRLLNGSATAVQALTELGSGYWILTPLQTADGSVVLINRGFVAMDDAIGLAAAKSGPDQPATITGLLRMSEPGGGFLRHNDPAANRWYSRDVDAIANARGLKRVAPYFIDADRSSSPGKDDHSPIGGLTVIAFHNNHLLYAITWYTLALMVPVFLRLALREQR